MGSTPVRRALVTVLGAALAASLASACGRSGAGITNFSAGPPTAPADLAATITTDAPDGFTEALFRPLSLGLEQFAAHVSDIAAHNQIILAKSGFRQGYYRIWENEAGSLLSVLVFEFPNKASASSAQEMFIYQNRAIRPASGFTVLEVAGAAGESMRVESDKGSRAVYNVWFVRGSRLYLVGLDTSDLYAPKTDVVTFASAQDRWITDGGPRLSSDAGHQP